MAPITADVIERLLYEEEGVSLDFKASQYRFDGASDDDKSELLKDILAFANAWRRSEAFILLGVEDVKGGRGRVVGVQSHLDDAQLQQFVNAKTQRPVAFSYHPLHFEGTEIAILQIPKQDRPLYLRRDFGRLRADTVYIRRGSSTDVARPDEIAKMGSAEPTEGDIALSVFFADPGRRASVNPVIRSQVLEVPEKKAIPDYSRGRSAYMVTDFHHSARADYYRELVQYTKLHRFAQPVYFAVSNSGSTTAFDVQLQVTVQGAEEGVCVLDSEDFPDPPKAEYNLWGSRVPPVLHRAEVTARRMNGHWLVEARAPKVQPKATHWFGDPVYIGGPQTRELELSVLVFADNLQEPHRQVLTLRVEATSERTDLDRILQLEDERFQGSEGFRRLLRENDYLEDGDEDDA
jgi:hypothetical protein